MLDVLKFIFADGWRFFGFLILFLIACTAAATVAGNVLRVIAAALIGRRAP